MSVKGKRRLPSVVEAAIAAKSNIKSITADTFRFDAAAILESLVAEFDEHALLDALNHQGFKAESYLSTLRDLIAVARTRRLLRNAGTQHKQDS